MCSLNSAQSFATRGARAAELVSARAGPAPRLNDGFPSSLRFQKYDDGRKKYVGVAGSTFRRRAQTLSKHLLQWLLATSNVHRLSGGMLVRKNPDKGIRKDHGSAELEVDSHSATPLRRQGPHPPTARAGLGRYRGGAPRALRGRDFLPRDTMPLEEIKLCSRVLNFRSCAGALFEFASDRARN
ncbi:hypothetical protein EVAR_19003_1 [Eumeta japonica]|uniref:Uncharacterized protein n=1 Tax=Eumeta variegata TaxID=151549 RepID=A0A4C1V8H7_EUMVA|nr:hypothetical protein EVAR_19003_1 [Eumeta japonica]